MCTATWSVGHGRLSLFFNRDERKSRSEARPPAIIESGGVKVIAAIDPDGDGTWLAASEYGFCVYLLNNYGAETLLAEVPLEPRSRGELPLRFAALPSRTEAKTILASGTFECYRPFLIVLSDMHGYDVFSWDGSRLEEVSLRRSFLTTSSYRTEEIQAYREARYETLRGSRAALALEDMKSLHLDTPHAESAFDPLMLRADSRTRSVSSISVNGETVEYRYWPVQGETRRLGEESSIRLPRKFGSRVTI